MRVTVITDALANDERPMGLQNQTSEILHMLKANHVVTHHELTGLRLGRGQLRLPWLAQALMYSLVPRAVLSRFGAGMALRTDTDAVHAEGLPACILASRLTPLRIPIIANIIDPYSRRYKLLSTLYSGPQKYLFIFSAWLASRLEASLRPPRVRLVVVSAVDAEWLSARGIPCAVMPMIADLRLPFKPKQVEGDRCKHVVMLGDLRLPQIREGFREAMTQLIELFSSTDGWRMSVLGRLDESDDFAARYASCGRIEFLPWVENIEDWIDRADVLWLPDLVGTGIKNRALQAIASGRPVVASRAAVEGIPGVTELNVAVRDCPTRADFEQVVLNVDHQGTLSSSLDRWRSQYLPTEAHARWSSLVERTVQG